MLFIGITSSTKVIAALGYSDEVLADSPVGYWNLDEVAGTTMNDSSGNSYDGTYNNGFTLAQSPLISTGNSVLFDGVAGTGATVDGTHIPLQIAGDVTLEAWVNLDGDIPFAQNQHIVQCSGTNSDASANDNFLYSMAIDDLTGAMYIFTESGLGVNQTVSSTHLITNGTHHIVIVRDATAKTVTFFDNGVEYDTIVYATNADGGSLAKIRIADSAGAGETDGVVDEVAVYDSQLSALRILAHYNAGGGVAVDPLFSSVVLLVRSQDAVNGQITFTDESNVARTLTRNGDTIYDGTQTKFGNTASILFDGSGDDWVEMPDAADLGLEDRTVEFCLEAWIYVTDDTSNNGIFVGRDNSSSEEFTFYTKTNIGTPGLVGLQLVIWNPNTVVGVDEIMTIDAWHHVAATRTENSGDGDLVLYVDGVSVATVTQTQNGATNTGVYYIGHNAFNSDRDFTGHIDSLRLTRNNARYTGNFTPSSTPFPAA
jgi:hypothetical protein